MMTFNGERKVNIVDALIYEFEMKHAHRFIRVWLRPSLQQIARIEPPINERAAIGRIEYINNKMNLYILSAALRHILYMRNIELIRFKTSADYADFVQMGNEGKARTMRVFKGYRPKASPKPCYVFHVDRVSEMREALQSFVDLDGTDLPMLEEVEVSDND